MTARQPPAADGDAALTQTLTQTMTVGGKAALMAFETMLGTPNMTLGPAQRAADDLALWAPRTATGCVVSVPLQDAAARGFWALALEEDAARATAAQLLKRPFTGWDALARSALLELGNVGACAFWGGIAQRVNAAFVPGVPAAQPGALGAALQELAEQTPMPRGVWATCSAAAAGQHWQATLWLILEQAATWTLQVGNL